MDLHLLRLLTTSFGGLGGWLTASAYLHRLSPAIPTHRLLVCWLCMAGATGLVAHGKQRRSFVWAGCGFLVGAPAFFVVVTLGGAAKRISRDAGSV